MNILAGCTQIIRSQIVNVLKENLCAWLGRLRRFLGHSKPASAPGYGFVPERAVERHIISREPVVAIHKDKLVLIVEAQLNAVPSWVEWDRDTRTIIIAQMNGDTYEGRAELTESFQNKMKDMNKVLVISNDNPERLMHHLPFIARV
jgi:hypothetical protein